MLHPSITEDRVADAVRRDEDIGFCKACGAEQDGCEPDARRYPCEECGKREVYGAEEILIELVP